MYKTIGTLTITDEKVYTQAQLNAAVASAASEAEKSVSPWATIPQQVSSVYKFVNSCKGLITGNLKITSGFIYRQRDSTKRLVDEDVLKAFLSADKTNNLKYVTSDRDCDDFSDILLGMIKRWDSTLMIGYCEVFTSATAKHALLCFINIQGQFKMLEPQTDEIKLPPSDWIYDLVQF